MPVTLLAANDRCSSIVMEGQLRDLVGEGLEKERTCSQALADDVDWLKKVLQEKEEVIALLGKLIEDLWVVKIEMARFYKKIEKENTDLVGENMTLHEHIRVMCLLLILVFPTHLFLVTNFCAGFSELKDDLLGARTTS